MSLTKYASLEVSEILDVKGTQERVKIASLNKLADFEDYRTEDGYLYARVRAISSRVNKNWDGWPSIELAGGQEVWDRLLAQRESSQGGFVVEADTKNKYGYSTFLGKPVFVDHHNSDPKKARGVIVDAKLHIEDHKTAAELDPYYATAPETHLPPTWVELLLEIDAKSFPRFAQAIVEGSKDPNKGIDGFSMGCDVEKTICSICKSAATSPAEYCSHVKLKGATFDAYDEFGNKTSKRAYEDCFGIQYFELSGVFDPADETALLREVRSSVKKEADDYRPGDRVILRTGPQKVTEILDYSGPGYVVGDPDQPDAVRRVVMPEEIAPAEGFDPDQFNKLPSTDDFDFDAPVQTTDHPLGPQTDRVASTHIADGTTLPQSELTKAPEAVDTLRKERVCEICGQDIIGVECDVCFTPETLVRTKAGYVPIATIEVGDEVLTESGAYHPVLEVMESDFNGFLYELRSKAMASAVRVTPGHPIKTLVGHHISKQTACTPWRCERTINHPRSKTTHELDWAPVSDLSRDRSVVAQTANKTFDRDIISVPEVFRGCKLTTQKSAAHRDGRKYRRRGPTEFELTDEFLWAIGLYIAEGCTGDRKITYSLHRNEVEYQERIRILFESLGFTTRLELRDNKPNSAWVHVHSSNLAEWFPVWLGEGCANKRIPAELFNLPLTKLEHVARGILDGDGCNSRNTLGQTSEVLALQMTEYALRRGGAPSIQIEYPPDKRTTYTINGTTATSVLTKPHTSRNLVTKKGTWKFQDQMLVKIAELKEVPYWGKVYNLRVANDASYVVQNLLVHNCGWTPPPDGLDNPDLDKAQERRERVDEESAPPIEDSALTPGVPEDSAVGGESYLRAKGAKARNNDLTEKVTNRMAWEPIITPRIATVLGERQSDEPEEHVVKDEPKPVTAQQIAEGAMRTSAEPADPSGKPDKRVDTTGVGGVADASNEQASQADKQVDVEGKGGTGVEDVDPDETQSVAQTADDNAGFDKKKNTDDSGKTDTFDLPSSHLDTGRLHDNSAFPKGGAKQGVDPVDPSGKPDERVDLEQEVSVSWNQNDKGIDQWTGTDGNGVTRQAPPVTPKVGPGNDVRSSAVLFAALKLVDQEVDLGITPRESKYDRIAELERKSPEALRELHAYLGRVRTAGLSRQKREARRLPSLVSKEASSPKSQEAPDLSRDDSAIFF